MSKEYKLKAKELIDKYNFYCSEFNAKECALICVQEILNSNPYSNPFNTDVYSTMDFWQQVRNEILNY
jgi:hypothetical protein